MSALAIYDPLTAPEGGPLFKEATCSQMAATYVRCRGEIVHAMRSIDNQCRMLNAAFHPPDDKRHYPSFGVGFTIPGDRGVSEEALLRHFKIVGWRVLVERLGVLQIMSVKKREQFEKQLNGDGSELPEITEDTIMGILAGLCEQAKDFAREACVEVFELLRPRNRDGGQHRLVTNQPFRVGRKVILTWWYVRQRHGGGFEVNYSKDAQIAAIDGVFHVLDGKGVIRERRGPLWYAIGKTGPDGKGETEYFKFRCFKNGNLHLCLKRDDLIQKLNLQAVGEAVIGRDME